MAQTHLQSAGHLVTVVVLKIFSLHAEQLDVELVDEVAEEVTHLVAVVITVVHLLEGVVDLARPVLV